MNLVFLQLIEAKSPLKAKLIFQECFEKQRRAHQILSFQ